MTRARAFAALALVAAMLAAARAGWRLAHPFAPFAQSPSAAPFDWHGDQTLRADQRVEAPGPFGDQEIQLELQAESPGLAELTLRQNDRDKAVFEVLVISADPRIPCGFHRSTSVDFGVPSPRVPRVLVPGEAVTLRVEARGSSYRASLDGELIDETSTPTFVSGMTAFAAVTGSFRLRALTVRSLEPARSWQSRPWLAAGLGALIAAALARIETLRFRASGAPRSAAAALAAGSALAVVLAWHEALCGRVTTFALLVLALVATFVVVLFLGRRWSAKHLRLHLAATLLLVATAVPALLAKAAEFPEERANELPFHAVSGPRFPADLAWYFHPLVRRFNSFLADHTFRRERYAMTRSPDTLRIACLGTSSTWGYPLPAGEAYPSQLGRLLTARGVQAEVLNAAVPGATAFRLGQFFDGVVRDFEPQIVTVSLFFNDSSSCLQYDEEALLAEITRADFSPSWLFRLRQNLALRRAQDDYAKARALAGGDGRASELRSLAIVQQGLRRFGAHLGALVASARKSGAHVVLIKEPARPGAFLQAPMHEVIDEVGRSLGVEVLDVQETLVKRLGEAGFVDWIHPTRAGHEIIAELLVERLSALDWLGPR